MLSRSGDTDFSTVHDKGMTTMQLTYEIQSISTFELVKGASKEDSGWSSWVLRYKEKSEFEPR